MEHYIIVKFKAGTDAAALKDAVYDIFAETLTIPGIHGVKVKTSNSDRTNRFDMMIVINMEKEALPAYNVSEPHKRWKAEYGDIIEKKAIFDCEG